MELPDEMILETLARLPTKDIIRCSSVSRILHSMLEEPFFLNLHTQCLSTNHSPLFVTSQGTVDQQHSTISFCIREGSESGKNNPTVYRYELPYRAFNPNTWDPDRDFRFSCSCNGLVCVAPEDPRKPIVLCNPHALGYITVPSCTTETLFSYSVGFGYSPSIQEYKLVCMTFDYDFSFLESEACPGKIMVYTIGAGTPWREVADAPFYVRKGPLYADGQIYWVVDFGGVQAHPRLIAFDVETEEYSVIDNISYILSSNIHKEWQLVELEGRVSVAFHSNGCMEIWMPVDGDISHWERRHNILIPQPTINNEILGIWERETHLHVWLEDCTMVCDEEWGSRFREYEGPNLLQISVWQLCSSYSPSMVSLKKYWCSTGERVTVSALGIEPPPAISLPPAAKPIIRLGLENEAEEEEKNEIHLPVLFARIRNFINRKD